MVVVPLLAMIFLYPQPGDAKPPGRTPKPSPTPIATSTPTPAPTATSIPTVEPTATPQPTATSVPTEVPTAAPTPTPDTTATATPASTPTPAPSPSASPTGTPQASTSGGWIVRCDYSHSLPDDPVVFPGEPGASHLHDFLANTTTDAFSTYESMIGGATTCAATLGDTGGYWVPALYKDGVKIDPTGGITRQQFYYRKNNLTAGTVIQPFPANFRMIAGNGHATSEADNPKLGPEIYWGCSDNSEPGKQKAPINCKTGIISLHVGFANCWDGVNLDSADHQSHVIYPNGGLCPADHPVALPRLIMRLEYPVGTRSSGIELSSGPYYTIHGDFWNTWDQQQLENLVQSCLNQSVDCGKL